MSRRHQIIKPESPLCTQDPVWLGIKNFISSLFVVAFLFSQLFLIEKLRGHITCHRDFLKFNGRPNEMKKYYDLKSSVDFYDFRKTLVRDCPFRPFLWHFNICPEIVSVILRTVFVSHPFYILWTISFLIFRLFVRLRGIIGRSLRNERMDLLTINKKIGVRIFAHGIFQYAQNNIWHGA